MRQWLAVQSEWQMGSGQVRAPYFRLYCTANHCLTGFVNVVYPILFCHSWHFYIPVSQFLSQNIFMVYFIQLTKILTLWHPVHYRRTQKSWFLTFIYQSNISAWGWTPVPIVSEQSLKYSSVVDKLKSPLGLELGQSHKPMTLTWHLWWWRGARSLPGDSTGTESLLLLSNPKSECPPSRPGCREGSCGTLPIQWSSCGASTSVSCDSLRFLPVLDFYTA